MTEEDKKWQAECDMRTLAEARMIEQDKARLAKAHKVGREIAKKKMQEAQVMEKIAKQPVKKAPVKKTSRKSATRKKRY